MDLIKAVYIINHIHSDVFTENERNEAVNKYLHFHLQADYADAILSYLFDKAVKNE